MFATGYDLRRHVVLRLKPSVHAAYRDAKAEVGTSIVAVYDTLTGLETHTSAELVCESARAFTPLMAQVGGERAPWLPGSRIKMVDGHGLEATERRLPVLREVPAAAFPTRESAGRV